MPATVIPTRTPLVLRWWQALHERVVVRAGRRGARRLPRRAALIRLH